MAEEPNDLSAFCVISPRVTAEGHRRNWKPTKEEAISHAKHMLASMTKGKRQLYVVQVIAVVEPPEPVMTVRGLQSNDTAIANVNTGDTDYDEDEYQ